MHSFCGHGGGGLGGRWNDWGLCVGRMWGDWYTAAVAVGVGKVRGEKANMYKCSAYDVGGDPTIGSEPAVIT